MLNDDKIIISDLQKLLSEKEAENVQLKNELEAKDTSINNVIIEKFNNYFDNAPTMLHSLDKNNVLLNVSNVWLDKLGYTRDEVIGKQLLDFFTPSSQKYAIETTLPEFNQNGFCNDVEYQFVTKDGNVIDVVLSAVSENFLTNNICCVAFLRDISKRKSNENELQSLSSRLLLASKAAKIGIWELDVTNKTIIIDQTFKEIFGFAPNENPDFQTILEMRHPDDILRMEDELQQAITKEKDLDTEYRIVLNDKSIRYIKSNAIFIKDEDRNKNIKVIGACIDITEQKKSEQNILSSEEKYRQLVETANEGIWNFDNDYITTSVNPKIASILGYTINEMIGKSFFDFMNDENKQIAEYILKLRHVGVKEQHDFAFISKKGKVIWAIVETCSFFKNGKPDGTLAMVTDITQRKTFELSLQEREKVFNDIFSLSPVSMLLVKLTNFEIIMANKSAENLFEYDQSKLIGLKSIELYANPDQREKAISKIIENRKIENFECSFKKSNGSAFESLLSSILVVLNNETYLLSSILDITKIKEMQNEMIRAKEAAEEMSNLKSNFLANMSHELRTPMNGILGFSQLITVLDDIVEVKEYAQLINSSSKRLMDTLNLILDLSTIESGVKELVLEEFDIVELISDNVNLFKINAEEKNLVLSFGSFIDQFSVVSNKLTIEVTLNNLINNAIKFTESGSIKVNFNIEINSNSPATSLDKDYIVIKIEDTGIGIKEDLFEIIFKEFRQASEGLNRNFDGTGLGLFIIKKYINMMDGEIFVESNLNVGSTFTFKLPLIEPKNKL